MSLRSYRVDTGRPGPRLLVTGVVHGDEICGKQAIEAAMAPLLDGRRTLARGSVTFCPVVNRLAYEKRAREGDRNLNRDLRPRARPQNNEDEVANAVCRLIDECDALLDLHSFKDDGDPFVFVGPRDNAGEREPFARSAEERAFATSLGVARMVSGWLAAYETALAAQGRPGDIHEGRGTTEYARSRGAFAVTLECGRNDDPNAPEIAARAIEGALRHLRLVEDAPFAPARAEHLEMTRAYLRRDERDRFARDWRHLDRFAADEIIARYGDGEIVRADEAGAIIFPWADAKPGREWFYLARTDAL